MRLSFKVLDEKKERLPSGEYGGTGKWDVYLCSLKGQDNTGAFRMAINHEEHEIDIQPLHPNDADQLSKAFSNAFHFKGSRQ